MEKQIKHGTFETDSNSIHSICISEEPVNTENQTVHFHIGEYGLENGKYDVASYLYTAIMCRDDCDELISKLQEILHKYRISHSMEAPIFNNSVTYKILENGYIDYNEETEEFINAVFADENLLLRCLLGNSYVHISSDIQDYDKVSVLFDSTKIIETPNNYDNNI